MQTAPGVGYVVLSVVSSLIVIAVAHVSPPSLYSDPAWQLRAIQEYLAGISPSPNTLVTANALDLSRDSARWIVDWAPGPVILAYPLMALGFTVGETVRILASSALIVGAIGWALWIGRFHLPAPSRVALTVTIPWIHYATDPLFNYYAEIFVFGAAPWVLLGADALARSWPRLGTTRPSFALAGGLGLAVGSLYVLKYSAVFIALGILVYLGVVALRSRTRTLIAPFGLVSAFCVLPILAVTVVNRLQGGSGNQATSTVALHVHWYQVVESLGFPAVAGADLSAVISHIFFRLHIGSQQEQSIALGLVGLPAMVGIAWMIAKTRFPAGTGALAISIVLTTVVGMFVAWAVTGAAGEETRFFAVAGIAILPLVIQLAHEVWCSHPSWRGILAVGLAFYLILPLGYGAASVIGKSQRAAHYVVDSSGIYNPLLSSTNAKRVRLELRSGGFGPRDVWYLPDPLSAIDLSVRAIIQHADFLAIRTLRCNRFFSRIPVTVHLLIPSRFESNGKGPVLRSAFSQATRWQRQLIPESEYVEWNTRLQVIQTALPAHPAREPSCARFN